ncbi:metal-dependent hydrolase family protein [Carbonactinospora thermoautotrophica]|uniref:metal-dependent hydrolase family protein n=1 Tax=Carbonactinospora thermoautotrophica TaxID=1469144 RepID=UPI001E2D89C5|nr:amidohydrolase family protein [Carbonactinospora thermoautotrophica]
MEEIDATGKTVMPGLIDAHCHMTYGESRTEEEIDLYTSPELRTLKAAWNAQKVLRAGVTGISQPGGSYYIGVGLREAIRDGIVLGPRMTSAGRYISTSNSLTDWYPDSVGVPEGSIGILANTLDGMIDELRHQVKNGVDLIKLADSPYGNYQAFTNDELKALADLAHQLGKRVTIHARGSAEVDAAVQAGIDWIMHGNVMSDETIEHLAESRIPLVPTLLLLANIVDWGEKVGAPKPMREGMARMLDRTADSLHRAHEAGVRFALGTDSGFSVTPYGEWHARELELLMTYAGLSPLEAIQAGTQNGAVMLNLEGEVGVIAPGMLADIIVVNGDPVKDIRVLQDKRRIETVIKDGRRVVFDEEAVSRRWPHERAQIYSVTDLTYDLVYGESDGVDGHVEPPLNGSDAKDLVADVKRREKSAGLSS